MQLSNRVDRRLLEKKIIADNTARITLSFYRYAQIKDPLVWRDELYKAWSELDILGRIYVAHEGINAQITVPEHQFKNFKNHLDSYDFLQNLRLNFAVENDSKSFYKLKILVRNKILADGLDEKDFDVLNSGIHLNAKDFNELAEDKNTILIDMRNHYESEVGHFKNAICPDVDTFRDSLPIIESILQPHKDKSIIMYCTGGIRCEKASAWFKYKGFENVYQLDGGIIEYSRNAQKLGLENKFIGKNFVFDRRLSEKISDDIIANCHQCGKPADTHINCANEACHLLFIQCESCAEKYEKCCSTECINTIHLPLEKQKELREGKNLGRQVFKKSRGNLPYMPKKD
jgi:UPF0176 protein